MARVWISYGELVGIIGADMAKTLCITRGGVYIYVPMIESTDTELAKVIGITALRSLIAVYGGEVIVVPNHRKGTPRKGDIIKMLDAGASAREIALRLDVTQRYVEHVSTVSRPKAKQASLFE